MSGYFALDPRAIAPDDHVGARVLLMGALGITPYVDRAMEVLERAERGPDGEHRALVIARDGTVAAMALFGNVAGAFGVLRIHAIVVAPGVGQDVGARLLDAVAATARTEEARMLVVELPDDPAVGSTRALLTAAGFYEEAASPISIATASRSASSVRSSDTAAASGPVTPADDSLEGVEATTQQLAIGRW